MSIFLVVGLLIGCFASAASAEHIGFRTNDEKKFSERMDSKLSVKVYAKGKGWMVPVGEGETAGTTGESRQLEAMAITVFDRDVQLKYRVYIDGYGWTDWVKRDTEVGTIGEDRAITGIQIKYNEESPYKVRYRAHIGWIGWTDWTTENGQVLGAPELDKRIEAIEVKLESVIPDDILADEDW